MVFRAGQTFIYPLGEQNQKEHLWIIATDPDDAGLFAIASFTSLRGGKDQTVVLRKGEHPFLKWDTCVHYALAEITDSSRLETFVSCNMAKMHRDATAAVLKYVLDGFLASDHTKNRVRDFVRAYKNRITKAQQA